jgi:hypothetical protein
MWEENMKRPKAEVPYWAEAITKLKGKLAEAKGLLESVDCRCTVAERDSGHLTGCYLPDIQQWLLENKE